MSYQLNVSEEEVKGKGKYKNAAGYTECVVFVQKAAGAQHTSTWRPGLKISEAQAGQIPRGTAIATFDSNGRYPTDGRGRHAAIYLENNSQRIVVLDQWNDQGEVRQRMIWFHGKPGTSRSNDANAYYVIK